MRKRKTIYAKSEHCIRCKELIEGEVFWGGGYWSKGVQHPYCSEDSRDKSKLEDAIICQSIDGDCNDCIDFKRERVIKRGLIDEGTCIKFNKKVIANPNFCSDHLCFRHRKTGKNYKELDVSNVLDQIIK